MHALANPLLSICVQQINLAQIFKDKAMVETMVGVKQKSQYRAVVEKALGAATVSA